MKAPKDLGKPKIQKEKSCSKCVILRIGNAKKVERQSRNQMWSALLARRQKAQMKKTVRLSRLRCLKPQRGGLFIERDRLKISCPFLFLILRMHAQNQKEKEIKWAN